MLHSNQSNNLIHQLCIICILDWVNLSYRICIMLLESNPSKLLWHHEYNPFHQLHILYRLDLKHQIYRIYTDFLELLVVQDSIRCRLNFDLASIQILQLNTICKLDSMDPSYHIWIIMVPCILSKLNVHLVDNQILQSNILCTLDFQNQFCRIYM